MHCQSSTELVIYGSAPPPLWLFLLLAFLAGVWFSSCISWCGKTQEQLERRLPGLKEVVLPSGGRVSVQT